MKLIKFILLLIIISILALSFTPMKLYYPKIEKQIRPIKLENISGSVVKGSAEKVKYLGMDLGQLKWLAYPSSYDTLDVDFRLRSKNYDMTGVYSKNAKADTIKNMFGTIDWTVIADKINFRHGQLSGYLQLDFQHIEFRDGAPERIIGTITTKELRLIKPIQKDMGEIEVVFTSDNPAIIVGQVNSKSNVLNVSGAVYLHKNRRWEIKLNLIPMPGEYEIEYALQSIGDPRGGGGRSLNLSGMY